MRRHRPTTRRSTRFSTSGRATTPCAGRTHNLAINYSYEIPGLSQHWDSGIVRAIFDGWEIFGVTSALSGASLPLTYSIAGVSDLTGGVGAGVDTRVDLTGDPNIPRGDRSDVRAFDTSVVRPPADPNRVGTARGDEFVGPGYLNWDISFLKNIPLGGTRRLQFRCELYNAFNNVQFSTVTTNAQFSAAGVQTNPEFGWYTAARDARRIPVHVPGAVLVWRRPPQRPARQPLNPRCYFSQPWAGWLAARAAAVLVWRRHASAAGAGS